MSVVGQEGQLATAADDEFVTDTLPLPAQGWTCFHCGAHFDPTYGGQRDARLHFGKSPDSEPACFLVRKDRTMLVLLREYQARETELLEELHAESGDAIKALRRRESLHAEELRRAEDNGYERGLRAGNYANEPGEWVTQAKHTLQEASAYLEGNEQNVIGSGSQLHRRMTALVPK